MDIEHALQNILSLEIVDIQTMALIGLVGGGFIAGVFIFFKFLPIVIGFIIDGIVGGIDWLIQSPAKLFRVMSKGIDQVQVGIHKLFTLGMKHKWIVGVVILAALYAVSPYQVRLFIQAIFAITIVGILVGKKND